MAQSLRENRIELLAPAGTMRHLRAAINSGADAVYLGGKLWGARASAGNFDDAEMQEAADYCHLRNAKLYVTMNTLMSDDEIEDALSYAKFLYEIGIDALIVQDFGFAAEVKRRLPDFPIHLSTQGTAYNEESVRAALEMGFERVVLARETSLEEIKKIKEATDAELEVFVHGALCFCYSGQCQMSRAVGGRSGNKGACAQPCRLPYTVLDSNGKGNGAYVLSPKDLCTIDFIGDIIAAGAYSLKIEGRMKSPEYVAIVTGIYRKYIDMYLADGYYRVSDEDRKVLNQIFNRGGFTKGYFYENPGERLMSGNVPKHQGVKIGKVIKRVNNDLIEIELDKDENLNMGDGIEIRNKEMPGNVVTYIKPAKNGKDRSASGSIRLVIGDIRGNVSEGDAVCKITDKSMMTDAAMLYELDKEGNERTVKRLPVSMQFAAYSGDTAWLVVSEGENTVTVFSDGVVETALSRPLAADRVSAQLAKTGNSTFKAADVQVSIGDDASLAMSQINKMRRDALDQLAEMKTSAAKRICSAEKLAADDTGADKCCETNHNSEVSYIYVHTLSDVAEKEMSEAIAQLEEQRGAGDELKISVALPINQFMDKFANDMSTSEKSLGENVKVMPYISNVSKGSEDAYIRMHFDDIAFACRECGIICGTLGWLRKFAEKGVPVTAGFGLNVTNGFAADVFCSMGASDVIPSLETVSTQAGAIPLMITEHMLPEMHFRNKKGDSYISMTSAFGDKTIIVPDGRYKTLIIF